MLDEALPAPVIPNYNVRRVTSKYNLIWGCLRDAEEFSSNAEADLHDFKTSIPGQLVNAITNGLLSCTSVHTSSTCIRAPFTGMAGFAEIEVLLNNKQSVV